jgi:hypothetical protein
VARIRTIKPDFFRHEALFEAEKKSRLPLRLAFAGLWTAADREGRFKWQPRVLKLDVLPFDEIDFSKVLETLLEFGFLVKYEVEGEALGHIPSWSKHQHINQREAASSIPAPDSDGARTCMHMHTRGEGKGKEGKGKEGEGEPARACMARARGVAGLNLEAWDRWITYRSTSKKPLKAVSLEEAAKEMAAHGVEQARVVAHSIANGWQGLFAPRSNAINGQPSTPERTWRPSPDEDEHADH